MHSRIYDPLTRNFDGQTVVSNSPSSLTVSDLYKVTELLDPLAPQEMISALLGAPTGLDMTPLGILLNEGGLVDLLGAYELVEADPTDTPSPAHAAIPETVYEIRKATTPDGDYRFWLDKHTGLLRRIAFPPTTVNVPPGIQQIELVAEIEDVKTSVQEADFVSDLSSAASSTDAVSTHAQTKKYGTLFYLRCRLLRINLASKSGLCSSSTQIDGRSRFRTIANRSLSSLGFMITRRVNW